MVVEISDKVILDFYPIISFGLPKVQGLGQVLGLNGLPAGQVRNGARQLQNAMISPRQKLHLRHG